MTIDDRLRELKRDILSRIAEAANAGQTEKIVSMSDMLKGIEVDERSLEHIEERLSRIKTRLSSPGRVEATPDQLLDSPSAKGPPASPKEWAQDVRSALAMAYKLVREKGTIYTTQSGCRIGIAAANETKPNNWFLGLADTVYDAVILVCQTSEGPILFGIDKEVVNSIWEQLSRSGGQVKFNVNFRGHRYELQLIGKPALDLTRFLDNRTPLT